jgi:ComF family protein
MEADHRQTMAVCQSGCTKKTTIDHKLRNPIFRFLPDFVSQDCQLCGEAAAHSVCAACDGDLPRRVADGCVRCGAAAVADQECGACLIDPPHFDATVAAFGYQFPLDRLIQSFKFSANLPFVALFADAFAAHWRAAPRPVPHLLVPMPLAAKRLAARGFNQSQLVAAAVGKRLSIPVEGRGLLRVRDTPPQTGLTREERLTNVRNAFECGTSLAGRSVALVDDVMTTGATMSEAARVLKKQGAMRVEAWVIARAERFL